MGKYFVSALFRGVHKDEQAVKKVPINDPRLHQRYEQSFIIYMPDELDFDLQDIEKLFCDKVTDLGFVEVVIIRLRQISRLDLPGEKFAR